MRNQDRYTTAQERAEAFNRFCNSFDDHCHGCPVADDCSMKNDISGSFAWLDLEAEEEKHETIEDIVREMKGLHDAGDWLGKPDGWDEENVVEALRHYADRIEAAHNRVAKGGRETEVTR